MRIVLKNAKFNTYGLADISDLLEEVSSNYGGISDMTPVETLFRALGADGSNQIWGKIKNLYMPVLAVPGDGIKSMYDIITKDNYPAQNYTVETGRGIAPTTLGNTIGSMSCDTSITNDNISLFTIFTQSSRQTLGSSSSVIINNHGITITWLKATISITGDDYSGDDKMSLTNSTQFTRANYVALSRSENGARTAVSYGTQDSHQMEPASGNTNITIGGWAATSLLAICDGLTSEEAVIVGTALNNFITGFGIPCVNS